MARTRVEQQREQLSGHPHLRTTSLGWCKRTLNPLDFSFFLATPERMVSNVILFRNLQTWVDLATGITFPPGRRQKNRRIDFKNCAPEGIGQSGNCVQLFLVRTA